MNVKLITNKKIIYFIILTITFWLLYDSYYSKYEIDTSTFKFHYWLGARESPDKQLVVYVYLHKESENSEIGYIQARLFPLDSKYNENYKTIFWEEIRSKNIENIIVNGYKMEYWVDSEWIDSGHIMINDIIVDINKGYDYRKSS